VRTIWKFTFELTDEPLLKMPVGAQIVHGALLTPSSPMGQPGEFAIWAVVDDQAPTEWRRLLMRGTGHPIFDAIGPHIATVQDGPFVWHIFDLGGSR